MDSEVVFTNHPIEMPALSPASREVGAVVEFHGLVREQEKGLALAGRFCVSTTTIRFTSSLATWVRKSRARASPS